jgi:hypothetical protein
MVRIMSELPQKRKECYGKEGSNPKHVMLESLSIIGPIE